MEKIEPVKRHGNCSYCMCKTDGTQYAYDDEVNRFYFCSPLHHMMYFHGSVPDADKLK